MNLRKPETLEKNSNHQPTMIYQIRERKEAFPLIMKVECNEEEIIAWLDDGRKVSIPVSWYPRTRRATIQQLQKFRITSDRYGIHWPEIDEDISVKAFINGLN